MRDLPGTRNEPVDEAAVQDIMQLTKGSAHWAAIQLMGATQAVQTEGAVAAALRCAIRNGLVVVVPRDQWPETIVSGPGDHPGEPR